MAMTFVDHCNKAMELRRAGKAAEAFEHIEKATELNPHDYHSWFEKAMILEDLGKLALAEEAYSECLKAYPKPEVVDEHSPNAQKYYDNFLGSIYFNRGILRIWDLEKEEEGKQDWLKAIECGHKEAEEYYKKNYN